MRAGAETHKAVLLKHGLSELVLALLGKLLDQFDAAVLLVNNGRAAHKGATQQLDALAAAAEVGRPGRATILEARRAGRLDTNLPGNAPRPSRVGRASYHETVRLDLPEQH